MRRGDFLMAFSDPFHNRTIERPALLAPKIRPRPIRAAPDERRADESRFYGHVASLPCQRPDCPGGCGRVEVAHSNQLKDGKGRGLKAPWWRVAALGNLCHTEIDSGSHLSKQERREQWDAAHRATIGELFARGLVRPTA